MADHELLPPDRAIDAKVWASTLATLAVSTLGGLHTAVQDEPALLFGLPTWAQVALTVALPPVVAFGAGWAKTSNRV